MLVRYGLQLAEAESTRETFIGLKPGFELKHFSDNFGGLFGSGIGARQDQVQLEVQTREGCGLFAHLLHAFRRELAVSMQSCCAHVLRFTVPEEVEFHSEKCPVVISGLHFASSRPRSCRIGEDYWLPGTHVRFLRPYLASR